ncbi:MAG TPA: LiaF-related protein [Paludibacter sp.]|nr:LiaF-related protein [Paludibacter sp.]
MKTELRTSHSSGYRNGLGFGLVLMLIGITFLGFNIGIIPLKLKPVIFSWQMLLILLGVLNFFKRHLVSGTVLILVGVFFIIPKLVAISPYFSNLDYNFTQLYWPMLLIVAGGLIIFSRTFAPKWWKTEWKDHKHIFGDNTENYKYTYTEGGFSKNSVFGSGSHIVLDPEFKGGDLNAVFGGITLDLRKTNLPEGSTILEVNAVFGGVTIYVPNDWFVDIHVDAVFGGFEDTRFNTQIADNTRKLILRGACVFGGGELRT